MALNTDKTMNLIHYLFLLFVFVVSGNLSAQNQNYFEAQAMIQEWMNKRIANAKKGKQEKVEFPMAVRTEAWGCRCPYHYMGISTSTVEGPWIEPVRPKGFPVSDDVGYSIIVVGYFTGNYITKDYRKNEGDPKDWVYRLPEFKVLSWRKNKLGYEVGGPKVLK